MPAILKSYFHSCYEYKYFHVLFSWNVLSTMKGLMAVLLKQVLSLPSLGKQGWYYIVEK